MYRIGFEFAVNVAKYLDDFKDSNTGFVTNTPIDQARCIQVDCILCDVEKSLRIVVIKYQDEMQGVSIEDEPRLKDIIIECLNKVV